MRENDYADLRAHIGVLSWKSAREALEDLKNNNEIPKKHEQEFRRIGYLKSGLELDELGFAAYNLSKDLEENTDFENLDQTLIQIIEEPAFKGFWKPNKYDLRNLDRYYLNKNGLVSENGDRFYTPDGYYLKQRLKSFSRHL